MLPKVTSIFTDIGYTKLIHMDIVTDPQLPPVPSKLFSLPLKHHKQVQKRAERSEEASLMQRSLLSFTFLCDCTSKGAPRCHFARNKMIVYRLLEVKCSAPCILWETKQVALSLW